MTLESTYQPSVAYRENKVKEGFQASIQGR